MQIRSALTLALSLLVTAVVAGEPEIRKETREVNGKQVEYTFIDGIKVHETDPKKQPQPPVVQPKPYDAEAAKPPKGAIVLFDGTEKTLKNWTTRDGKPTTWEFVDGSLKSGKGYIQSKEQFGSCRLHIEFATPSVVKGNGQGRGNSGVFLMGQYEIQVLDSYNNKTYPDGQCGALYGRAKPLVNASRKPGEWQTYDIIFHRPIFDQAGKVVRKAKFHVIHNGHVIHDHVELSGGTGWRGPHSISEYRKHADTGPLQMQDHGNPVRFRNVWIQPLPDSKSTAIKHSFLGAGKANKAVIVNEDGKVEWKLDLPASDGWVLPNGNVLLALYRTKGFPNGGFVEVDRKTKKILVRYQGQQKETSTVQKLPDGNYLVAELGPEPRAVVVNPKGKVVKTMPLACQKKNAHMQTRMLRLLPNGNYIAPHLFDFAVKEYDSKTGKVLRTFPTDDRGRAKRDWPFTAIRLKNGNTLIGCTNGNRVIEVDENGKIVWKCDNEDIGEKLFDDACGIQRLPNGNTVISSYHAKGDSVKLFEVTRDKKVVWRYSGQRAGFHHFQILTTNGKSLANNTLK